MGAGVHLAFALVAFLGSMMRWAIGCERLGRKEVAGSEKEAVPPSYIVSLYLAL